MLRRERSSCSTSDICSVNLDAKMRTEPDCDSDNGWPCHGEDRNTFKVMTSYLIKSTLNKQHSKFISILSCCSHNNLSILSQR